MIEIPNTQFVVMGDWDETPVPTGKTDIRLAPSLAWGVGSHPTTQWFLQKISTLTVEGKSVLDIGAGTGILSIAAAKSGASSVTAVEVDTARSLPALQTNFSLNPFPYTLIQGSALEEVLPTSDIILLNLDSLDLIKFILNSNLLNPSGTLLIDYGVEFSEEMTEVLSLASVSVVDSIIINGWEFKECVNA